MRPFRILCASLVMFFLSALLFAQTPARPAFEVASVKPVSLASLMTRGGVRPGMTVTGNRFDCAMALSQLIEVAYRIRDYQVAGPDWLNTQRFEIHATLPEDTSKDRVPEMLQTLLEERFKLKAHLENKEQPAYALVVSKGGAKLMNGDDTSFPDAKPFTPDGRISFKREGDSTVFTDSRTGPIRMSMGSNGVTRQEILRISMSMFAEWLTPLVDRPVLDATNLKGFYRMTVEFPQEVFMNSLMRRPVPADFAAMMSPFGAPAQAVKSPHGPAGNASDPSGKAVFNAVEKLGLKLDPRKAPIKTLIIEHVEKNPTEN